MAYKNQGTGILSKTLPYLLGTIFGIGIMIAGTAIMTQSVSTTGSYNITKIGTLATALLAGFLGSGIGCITTKENKLTTSLIIACVLIFTMLGIAIFGLDGLKGGIWKTLVGILAGALISGWIGINGKGNRAYKKMRSR